MTKLTHQHLQHHDYITPQHEQGQQFSHHRPSTIHAQPLSPLSDSHPLRQGYASLPIHRRGTSESCVGKAEQSRLDHQPLPDDLADLSFDLDRMSEHDPSSGDGEEEPLSPDTAAPYQGQAPWKPASSSVRPPPPAGPSNPNFMTGKPSASKAAPAQSPSSSRQAPGQSSTTLPTEKVFPIQVGTELFRLSGASISSDGPSYFTQWFEDQIKQNEESGGVKTLYLDRDPETFRDIARHLQGYYIKPRDGPHFVRLFADAQFYSLPRFISQLFESEIFIQIGEQHFQIPKDIFSDPGNSPNFFSLGFAVFFSTPSEVFPGLDRRGLLRPPPINPPYVPTRSAEIFAQLLHVLRGYPLRIKDEAHRTELLRDCRYFHLRGLEQRIIAHDISYNLERCRSEIVLRLSDLKPSGISYRPDDTDPSSSAPAESGWVHYARPFVDEQSYELIVEIGGESTVLDLDEMRVDFHGKTKAQVSRLFQVIANKMGLASNEPLGLLMLSGGPSKRSPSPGHSPLSEDKVRVRFESASDITLNNASLNMDWSSEQGRHMRTGVVATIILEDDSEDSSSPSDEPRNPPKPVAATRRSQTSGPAASRTPRNHPRSESDNPGSPQPPQKKRKVDAIQQRFGRWTIRNGQWRLRVEPSTNTARGKYEIAFIAVKVDAFKTERARNVRRLFLG